MGNEASEFDRAVRRIRAGGDPHREAESLHAQLSASEKLGLLDGDTPFWEGIAAMNEGYNVRPYVHGAVERLGIPGVRFVDGPRGVVSGHGTAFPVSTARGATWDPELEERVGVAIGQEVRAVGGNFFGGVCINLPRHPAWGRAQETYGDEPYHLGELGAALTRGVERYAMACAKHFALNSMENARFSVDVSIDEATLHEIYLPHFRRVVDEGVSAIMPAYNSVNGEWAGQNRYLLTDVLREQWQWDGITVSDFIWGLRDAAASLEAGLDLEEPFAQQRAQHLPDQLDRGETSWDAVDRAGRRLIFVQLRSYARRDPVEPSIEIMACSDHRALAREVARRAMVLLRNEPVHDVPVLPLEPASVRSLAVIGRLATAPNMGDRGSSDVHPPSHVTPLDGLRAAYPDAQIVLVEEDDPIRAAEAAAAADAAIIVAGFDERDEGEYVGSETMTRPELLALFPPAPVGMEGTQQASAAGDVVMTAGDAYGGDRRSLTLRPVDEQIIHAVAAANPRTVVAVVGAGAVLMQSWSDTVPAVVMMWYAGMEGGHALADVLTGAHSPSGRLPFSIPTSAEHLPPFERDATAVTYDRLHGQRMLDSLGVPAAFPHGFGLSYTTFEIESATADAVAAGQTKVSARVRNTGSRDGRHVVQVYGRRTQGAHADEAFVVGFASVEVPAGHIVEVEVPVSLQPLALWAADSHRLELAPGTSVQLEVGSHAHDGAAVVLAVAV